MTLEEAIKHCEEVAEKYDTELNLINCGISNESCENCLECAKEHRQLAEWLRELKKLREIPSKLVSKYRDGIQDEYNCGANDMLEEVIDDIRKYMKEVKADADSD